MRKIFTYFLTINLLLFFNVTQFSFYNYYLPQVSQAYAEDVDDDGDEEEFLDDSENGVGDDGTTDENNQSGEENDTEQVTSGESASPSVEVSESLPEGATEEYNSKKFPF